MTHLSRALAVALLALLPLRAQAGDDLDAVLPEREEWLAIAETLAVDNAARDAGDPLTAPMNLCEDRGCLRTGWQALSGDEAAALRAVMAGAGDAAEERRRLGRAIALLETLIGARNGTWRDHAANLRQDEDEPGQMDCIAESLNTRTYVDRLFRAGLLLHHHPGDFIHRYTVVLQHVAIDIVDNDGGEHYAVDAWVGANGEEPEIIPYSDWRWEWGV